MTTDSNRDWIDWGERDPFYGVATFGEGREKGGANEWTPEDLYASGAADWEIVSRKWEAYGFNAGTVVEIGCGVGRYSNAMASSFDQVVGVDVSPGMLEQAESLVKQPNVRFELGDGMTLPMPDRSCDAAFSAFVFQHFDSTEFASRYFRELARVLKPGSTVLIHLPLHQYPVFSHRLTPVLRFQYSLVKRIGTWRAERDRKKHREGERPLQFRLISYELAEVTNELRALGFSGFEVAMFTLPSYPEEWLSMLFATKTGV